MAGKAWFGNPFKRRVALDAGRANAERLQKQGFLRGEVGAIVREAHLLSLAKTIVEARDLPASENGRSIARLGLQKAFLKRMVESRRGYKRLWPSAEKACLRIAQNAEKVHSVLWDFKHKKISFREAAEMYEAAAGIMKSAQVVFKGNIGYNPGKLRDMERSARANASMLKSNIAAGETGSVTQINQKELRNTAEIGERIIETLADKLPEDSQIGFELIENLVQEHLGGQ